MHIQQHVLNYMDVKEQSERVEQCRADARAALASFRASRLRLAQDLRHLEAAREALRAASRTYWRMHGRYLKACIGLTARGAQRLFQQTSNDRGD